MSLRDLFCSPNETADLRAFQFIEGPTSVPILFPNVSNKWFSGKLLFMLKSAFFHQRSHFASDIKMVQSFC